MPAQRRAAVRGKDLHQGLDTPRARRGLETGAQASKDYGGSIGYHSTCMRILLTKISDERHALEVVRANGDRERVEHVSREFLFHDLLHYAVESELGTQGGFWGALAKGKSMSDLNDRTGTAMGDLSPPIAGIEAIVGMMTGVVKSAASTDEVIASLRGYLAAMTVAAPEWCTAAFVNGVRERMRQIFGRWKAVPYRGSMEIQWPHDG